MPNITRNNRLFIVQILLTLINTIQCMETSTRPPNSTLKFRIKINKTHFEQQEKGRNFHENDYFGPKFGEYSSNHPSSLLSQYTVKTEPGSPRVSSHRRQVRTDSAPETNSPRATPTNSESELRRQQMRRVDSASSIASSTAPKGVSSSNPNYLIDTVKDEPEDDVAPMNG